MKFACEGLLPWSAAIMICGEPDDRERTGPEPRRQFGHQRFRFGSGHLVLDRDVKPRRSPILRGEHAVEMIGNACANAEQRGAVDPEGGAATKRVDLADPRCRRRRVGRNCTHQPVKLVEARRRKLMKERDMRGEMVAVGREMRSAEDVEEASTCCRSL